MSTKQALISLLETSVKSNSNKISSNKTTGTGLKSLLRDIINIIPDDLDQGSGADFDRASADERYHTRIRGEIKMYWGDYFSLPKGWAICDGTNGTPDLRGKVPVGWGAGYKSNESGELRDYDHLGREGGESSVRLEESDIPSHRHTGTTNFDGDHVHTYPGDDHLDNWAKRVSRIHYDARSKRSGRGSIYQTGGTGKHSHSFSTSYVGDSDNSHENRQPYNVVMYIMYIGATVENVSKVTPQWDPEIGLKSTVFDSDGNWVSGPESNMTVGLQFTGPVEGDGSETISNVGFIPKSNPLRGVEKAVQKKLNFDDEVGTVFISRITIPNAGISPTEYYNHTLDITYNGVSFNNNDSSNLTTLGSESTTTITLEEAVASGFEYVNYVGANTVTFEKANFNLKV